MANTPDMKVHLDAYLTLRATSSDDNTVTLKPHALYVGGHPLGTFTDDDEDDTAAALARLVAHYEDEAQASFSRFAASLQRLRDALLNYSASLDEAEPDTTYEHFKLLTIHKGWHPLAACAYLGLTKRDGLVFWSGTHTNYLDEHGNVLHTEYTKG